MTEALTHERLLELLHYDPETGHFTNRVARGGVGVGERAGCRVKKTRHYGRRQLQLEGYLYHETWLIWYYMTGEWPPRGFIVGHKNNIWDDNRWNNLYIAKSARGYHCRKPRGRSGVVGVTWSKKDQRWRAYISIDGKQKCLGNFKTKEEATEAREQAVILAQGGL